MLKRITFKHTPTSNRICLFAHFDICGHIDPVVIHYLDAIKKVGLDIVIITTSPSLLESSIENGGLIWTVYNWNI